MLLDSGWIRQFTAPFGLPDRLLSLGLGRRLVFVLGPGTARFAYLTGIVVPAGIGTALTLFFALPVATRSL